MSRFPSADDDDVAPLIPQATPQHGGANAIPLGSPAHPHTPGHRRSDSSASAGSLGDASAGGTPSKLKPRSFLHRQGLAYCVVLAAIAVVWISIDYATTETVQEAERGQSDVSHSSHLWGKDTRPGSVESISILGERSSGTTWLFEHLGLCFNHSVPVHRRLTRYKHWFQYNVTRPERRYPHSLVINEFRNVYDWTEAMHKVPHHAPNHMDLGWKEFVTRPWTMKRFGKDLEMTEKEKSGRAGRVCQEAFYYRDIITCHTRPYPDGFWNASHPHRYSEHQPFYEMRNDGSGEPYNNILELRAAKIYNFLSVVDYDWVEDMWVIRYETLLAEGTKALIAAVEKATGAKANCRAAEAQNRRKRKIDPGMRKWLKEHVDWEAEGLIGYKRD